MSKKEKRDIELFIVDVLTSIQQVKRYTKKFHNSEEFLHDELHWDGTIRQLEIIGEALNNLLNDDNFSSVAPKYFRKIVNFRNSISHGYFGIDSDEVWDIVQNKLHVLETDIKYIIINHIDIQVAIDSTIKKYKELNNLNMIEYLTSLYSEQ